jgi:hypothetical protein
VCLWVVSAERLTGNQANVLLNEKTGLTNPEHAVKKECHHLSFLEPDPKPTIDKIISISLAFELIQFQMFWRDSSIETFGHYGYQRLR